MRSREYVLESFGLVSDDGNVIFVDKTTINLFVRWEMMMREEPEGQPVGIPYSSGGQGLINPAT